MNDLENKAVEISELTKTLTEICLAKISEGQCGPAIADKLKRGIALGAEEIWNLLREDDQYQKIMNDLSHNSSLKEKILIEKLLNCDYERAQIEAYDRKRLTDPNQGHWDLWQNPCAEKYGLTARNPVLDIRHDGLIGIDFGTKSTVVVCQDGNEQILPMRIGIGRFSKELNAKQFENPTVMEFRDINSFLADYSAAAGRPATRWEDLTVSHTAYNDLLGSKSDDYYSYFADLKQWSGNKGGKIIIKDKKGIKRQLPDYLDIMEGDFDPIEIYAYYLGLYINNMHTGIYLDYLLSFPVTYEMKVRERLIQSFSNGLKKSLPQAILENAEAMQSFRVREGASEPAAYALCALQEYGIEPDGEETVFYGIFDFGGGTTDFDFGTWQAADLDDNYDYIIRHYGASGDKYLGGENLLELLAFEVFKDNQEKLRKEEIAFQKPDECLSFAGSEILISDSQEAKINMKQLMEKFRPLWEQEDGYEKLYENGLVKVNLFDKNGVLKLNTELDFQLDKLENILKDRIEKGVRNFFDALKLSFMANKAKNIKEMIIFLAGNSSKSPVVLSLFKAYVEEINKDIQGGENRQYFKIYPPLGTKEALEIQQERGIAYSDSSFIRPTGKTGVAFGLIDGREGGMIKIISADNQAGEIKFNYYLGRNRRKKFLPVLMRDTEYNQWVKFAKADVSDFEIYYTDLPEASSNGLPIAGIKKKRCRISVTDENAYIYIRAVKPSVIQYVVAETKDLDLAIYLTDINELELN
ncbi:MAG: molecular chaperone DnaK [bacterium]